MELKTHLNPSLERVWNGCPTNDGKSYAEASSLVVAGQEDQDEREKLNCPLD